MELDDAYSNGAYIPGADEYPAKWQAMAESFRAGYLGAPERSYGESERQRMDVFEPKKTAKGLFVFVHGGYWKAYDKSSWSHLAGGMLARGWAVALPSYDLCPEVRISDITPQIARAVTVAAERIGGPIVLAGHSAGGHLAARMVCRGVLPKWVAARLGHVMAISPLADLRPLLRTTLNDTLGLDPAEAEAESPLLCEDRLDVPVTVWVGEDERPAFHDQARQLAETWQCRHEIDPGRHHFDVIDPLSDPDSRMVRVLVGEA
ncbi:alpha/beta hydrolase [Shimia sp.]|uniref:alpha/beta hydrolase n=1 Tax=Shimia sp. TaxID=1954381 RepID=UPI00356870F4